ncbi:transferrin-binding protein-like solute binding protein [Cypionkella psychrotolerans]|uniref:transferrin-binding protein-like solute binding protein n=1 Tax=Cypionkella psychrotolerans TaxID=1678131 RepID=UPI000AC694C7|nr:transferrin-binding protein-like solute binding protein [Cypionkella psychrotolerans]
MLPFGKYAALTAVLAMSACTSSGGGSGSLSAAQVRALPVTATMPTSGKATYKGKTSQTDYEPSLGGNLTLTSDVRLDANFATNQIDGTVSNIKAKAAQGSVAYDGSLRGTGNIYGSQFDVRTTGVLTSRNTGNTIYTGADIDGTFKGTNADAIDGSVTFVGSPTTSLIAIKQ